MNNTKQELEEILRNYQNVSKDNIYELKKLNDSDEAENIFIMQNTIFIGTEKMQIKKLDGTIEKFKIDKYYPVDEKDEKIKELNRKVEELERRLNNESNKHIESDTKCDESSSDGIRDAEPKPETAS